MKDDEKLSEVKKKILKLLQESEWVGSKTLLEETNQKYFDRRIRELRDELGYDIITEIFDNEHHYKLRSEKRNPVKTRTYLNKTQKNQLIKESPKNCLICDKDFNEKVKRVFDHKVPLIRGGDGSIENFQLICNECNNQKRSQCRGCELDCNECFFAYPEKYPKGIILKPKSKQFWDKLKIEASKRNLNLEDFILEILKKIIK